MKLQFERPISGLEHVCHLTHLPASLSLSLWRCYVSMHLDADVQDVFVVEAPSPSPISTSQWHCSVLSTRWQWQVRSLRGSSAALNPMVPLMVVICAGSGNVVASSQSLLRFMLMQSSVTTVPL